MIQGKADLKDYASAFRVVLGTLIKEKRIEAHLAQEELAKRVQLAQPSMVEIEKGTRKVSIDEFCNLAINLGMQPEDLLLELEDCWQVLYSE